MFRLWIVVFVVTSLSEVAYGRRAQRDGFNFGTSLYLDSGSEPSVLGGNSGSGQSLQREEQRYKPYVGYAFNQTLNLGVGFDIERQTSDNRISGINPGESLLISESKQLGGGHLFARLLFGKIFFMQAGVGYYERKVNKEAEVELVSGEGYFSGRREEWSVRAGGAGFHGTIGLEIPVTQGFYVASSYEARILRLNKISSSGDVANYSGDEQIKQFNFGIAYYFR